VPGRSGFSRGRGDIREPLLERPGGWVWKSASARNTESELRLPANGNYQAGSGLARRRWTQTQGLPKRTTTGLKWVVRPRQDCPSRFSDCSRATAFGVPRMRPSEVARLRSAALANRLAGKMSIFRSAPREPRTREISSFGNATPDCLVYRRNVRIGFTVFYLRSETALGAVAVFLVRPEVQNEVNPNPTAQGADT
jgi:hypothetical protein